MSSRAFLKISLLADFGHFFEKDSKLHPFLIKPCNEVGFCSLRPIRGKKYRYNNLLRFYRKIQNPEFERLDSAV